MEKWNHVLTVAESISGQKSDADGDQQRDGCSGCAGLNCHTPTQYLLAEPSTSIFTRVSPRSPRSKAKSPNCGPGRQVGQTYAYTAALDREVLSTALFAVRCELKPIVWLGGLTMSAERVGLWLLIAPLGNPMRACCCSRLCSALGSRSRCFFSSDEPACGLRCSRYEARCCVASCDRERARGPPRISGPARATPRALVCRHLRGGGCSSAGDCAPREGSHHKLCAALESPILER